MTSLQTWHFIKSNQENYILIYGSALRQGFIVAMTCLQISWNWMLVMMDAYIRHFLAQEPLARPLCVHRYSLRGGQRVTTDG